MDAFWEVRLRACLIRIAKMSYIQILMFQSKNKLQKLEHGKGICRVDMGRKNHHNAVEVTMNLINE